MATPLTEKQRRFVKSYMGKAAGNATEAARLAGYQGNDQSLSVSASRLLRNAKVMKAIEGRVEGDPFTLGRLELQRWWSSVVRGDEEQAMRDRLKASELLGRSQGAFVERVEIEDGPELQARTRAERRARITDLAVVLGIKTEKSGGNDE